MAITSEQLIEIANARGKNIPSDKAVNAQNALDKVDQALIQTEEEGKVAYEVWDRISDINGVPAEKVLQRNDIGEGEIYLVRDKETGRVLFFQPFEPGVEGLKRMTSTNVATIADNHRKNVATERANNRIVEEAFKNLNI